MSLPPPTHAPADVRALAHEILRQSRYRRAPESLPDRAWRWLGEHVASVLANLVAGGGVAVVAWIVLLAAIGGVVYLLVRHGRVTLPVRPEAERAQVMVELTRSPKEWRAEAERLEAEGRWREALRCRHRAVIGELVRRGAIPDQAGRTAGEYVRDVAIARSAAAPALAALTELFELAWYGGVATGPDEAARAIALDRQILADTRANAVVA
jgi:Domain of unknown function (DUF4129)